MTVNIRECVWQDVFVLSDTWGLCDLQPLTPLDFIGCLNNLEVSGSIQQDYYWEKFRLQHLHLGDNNSALMSLGYILCKDADGLLISWLLLSIEINVLITLHLFSSMPLHCASNMNNQVWEPDADLKIASVSIFLNLCNLSLFMLPVYEAVLRTIPEMHTLLN